MAVDLASTWLRVRPPSLPTAAALIAPEAPDFGVVLIADAVQTTVVLLGWPS
jgi:hypothetical protein